MQTHLGAFSASDFRDRAACRSLPLACAAKVGIALTARPSAAPAVPRGDHDLNPDLPSAYLPAEDLHPAAVLVPVVDRGARADVILTVRSLHMPAHAGQIAFPGGRLAPCDASPIETALREASEEIGLAPEFVTPLGVLDTYRTGTGFLVVPVLAIVSEGFTLHRDEREVADVFDVPLSFLMTETNFQRHTREIYGKIRHFHAIPYGEYYIWGATAGILRSMYERLYAE